MVPLPSLLSSMVPVPLNFCSDGHTCLLSVHSMWRQRHQDRVVGGDLFESVVLISSAQGSLWSGLVVSVLE